MPNFEYFIFVEKFTSWSKFKVIKSKPSLDLIDRLPFLAVPATKRNLTPKLTVYLLCLKHLLTYGNLEYYV
ncbi:hypothetical protein BpHYR1_043234 [Brachionus plicatilis]|uniref:Uncharacterized protein n=1 Tax=Brachionus plicatilis TaxID=10195 RepID=A0A3M7QBY1_BRAPC|nr:hypothetical protein BpHYR1_043234 [Brachionus plicatilis]